MNTTDNIEASVEQQAPIVTRVRAEIGRILVGQSYMIDRLLIGLMANGHVLVEGVPGLAKTTAVKALAQSMDLEFSRIQFTPDLLPADLIGTQIYQPNTGEFATRKGPVFTNILLADEINRAPAKVQSALLESMEERQITLGEHTWPLPQPFLTLATQNPIEQEGTYPLPEAQLDRFMFKLRVHYPTADEELEVIKRSASARPELTPVLKANEVQSLQDLVSQIHVTEVLMSYIVAIVRATRDPGSIDPTLANTVDFGASPRASIALAAATRGHAFLDGRAYTLPEDVKAVAPDVLRHRVLPSYEAEAEGLDPDTIVARILDHVEMP